MFQLQKFKTFALFGILVFAFYSNSTAQTTFRRFIQMTLVPTLYDKVEFCIQIRDAFTGEDNYDSEKL